MMMLGGRALMTIFVFLAAVVAIPIVSSALAPVVGDLPATAIALLIASILGLIAYYVLIAGRLPNPRVLLTIGLFTAIAMTIVYYLMTYEPIALLIASFVGVSLGIWAYTMTRR